MSEPRLLVYVQHLLGVGHVKRAAGIARACRRAGIEVCVVIGGEHVPRTDFGGAITVELEPVRALDMTFKTLVTGDNMPVTQQVWLRRQKALLRAEMDFEPDALLTEHYPFGRRQFAAELAPLIDKLRSAGKPVLSSVRDVLVDKKDATKSQKTAAIARSSFDRVLVHGDPNVVEFGRTFAAAGEIADLIVYTGYMVEEGESVAAKGRDGEGEVIVSTGGGAVGSQLLFAAAEAATGGALSPRRWRLLAGDNLPETDFARLSVLGRPNLLIERARPDFRSLLRRCALSISQAGYNTMMDILVTGCPALVVPFAGAAESEQSVRASEFARRGLLAVLDESELSAERLARSAAEALQSRARTGAGIRINIDVDGARRSADIILEVIEQSRRRRPS